MTFNHHNVGGSQPATKKNPSYSCDRTLYPLVVILGPTASGKSELALSVAERYNGEVINYDSVQVYRHFNIGTAKLSISERRGIAHHLIDVVEPEELFTAGDYAKRARESLSVIRASGRVPVLVGGTGFYLRALLSGLFDGPRRDEALRHRLEQRSSKRSPGHLHRVLQRLDALSAQRIHRNDTPKIVRAIEVCLRAREPMSSLWQKSRGPLTGYEVIRLGISPQQKILHERIKLRAENMFGANLVEEVQELLAKGVSRHARAFGSLGYKQTLDYLDGKKSLKETIAATVKFTRRLAKRQLTWFRSEPEVHWFEGFGDDLIVQQQVLAYLEKKLVN